MNQIYIYTILILTKQFVKLKNTTIFLDCHILTFFYVTVGA